MAVAIGAPGDGWAPVIGLLALAAVAFAGVVLAQRASGAVKSALLFAWAAAAVLGCGLTGGLPGPLAATVLAPIVAAALLGGRRRLALGAALALDALAVLALAQTLGLVAAPLGETARAGLQLGAVACMAAGLTGVLFLAARPAEPQAEAAPEPVATDPAPLTADIEAALRARLEQQPHLMLVLGEGGRVLEAYGAPPPCVGVARLEAEGLLSLAEPDRWRDLQAALKQAEHAGHGAIEFALAGAPEVWLGLEARPMADGRLIASLRDATAAARRAGALEAARADAEALNIGKSRFLANMSHELRTPLNAIMGFSDIMREKMFGPLPAKYAEYAELIHDAGSHLLALINDVLDMSKIEAARYELALEELDAREPVQAALRLMRRQADEAGVQLRGVLAAEPLEAVADRRALKQITLNLISNALKFTPTGGLVTVSLDRIAGALELSVADTGVGIAPEDLARLGRPYEQAGDAGQQAQGTGLGLSLVRAFAELHGGEMLIESRLGAGTAVTVRLPVLEAGEPIYQGAQVIAFPPQR
jgi:cell cycle sensor histidine kinase DivJ